MTTVSVSAYARMHGVAKGADQKWQSRGLLKMVDGKVNVEASDQSLAHAGVGRFADAATRQRRSATGSQETVAVEVAALPAAMIGDLEEAAAHGDENAQSVLSFMSGLAEGRTVDLITAQTIKENGLAAIRMIEARKRAGEVVEMADAEAVIFDVFRRQRDAWLNFPSRVGPLVAAELGLAPDRVVEMLTIHVHQQLTLYDEVDKYPITKEGDPFTLGDERQATFSNALSVRVCSPTVAGESRIESSYLDGDQRKASVACPHCDHRNFLSWAHVQWPKQESEGHEKAHQHQQAQVFCEACGTGWSEGERLKALSTIRWHQTRPSCAAASARYRPRPTGR